MGFDRASEGRVVYQLPVRGADPHLGMYPWLDRAPRGATRRTCDGAATTSAKGADQDMEPRQLQVLSGLTI
jgi:hypothetical protein